MPVPRPTARDYVRIKRRGFGLSLDDVAFALGVSVSACSRFERGLIATLPGERGEKDYERVLDELESEARVRGAA